ncbi:MAG: hypothetical protein HY869_20290 [Chloroflexi bacterium]|nr:hypothetical protein [Chloroflexota bacterium]
MKRKAILMLGGFILVVAFVLGVWRTQTASAKNTTLKEILFPKNPAPQVVQATATISPEKPTATPTVFPEGMQNPPTRESLVAMVGVEQMKKNEIIVEDIKKLTQQAENIYLYAGWIHSTTKTEGFPSTASTLPDGSPVPTAWTTDIWLLLDKDGCVVQGINIQDTGSPITSEVSKYENGVWTNLTLEISFDTKNKSYCPIDGVLEKAINDKDIVELTLDDGIFREENVKIFTVIERTNKPLEIAKTGNFVNGSVLKYYISINTGLVIGMEQYDISPDEKYILVQRSITILDEKIEQPPTEVLDYLK